MRLNRFLAAAGLGSRRSCEELIRTGQVTINGVLCENLATTVEPTDVVKLGNRVLHTAAPVTLLLNKPPGYLCTASDTHNRQTIFDLLPANFPRLFNVGRLDRDSEGLLIVTNDGALSLKLTHPRYKVEKEYEVILDRPFDFDLTAKLLHGISLEEGWAKAESVFKLAANKLKVVLRQGMKRQIRLMFYALGYEVKRLTRVRIGSLEIRDLPPGSWRALTQKEIDALLEEGAKTSAEEPAKRPVRKPRGAAARQNPKREWRERRDREEDKGHRIGRRDHEKASIHVHTVHSKGYRIGRKDWDDWSERPARTYQHAGKKLRRDFGEIKERFERPRQKGTTRPSGRAIEEIPFVPRASRQEPGEHTEKYSRFSRPGGHFSSREGRERVPEERRTMPGKTFEKEFGKKRFASKPGRPAGKSAFKRKREESKPAPRPFAKFERRRRG